MLTGTARRASRSDLPAGRPDPPAARFNVPEAALTTLVAAVIVVLALAEGGYSPAAVSTLSIAIWWIVLIALGLGLAPRERVPRTALIAGASLAALAGWTALSMGWADDDGRAFVEVVRVSAYAGAFVAAAVFARPRHVRSWITGLTIGLSVVTAIALGSRLQEWLPGDNRELAELLPDVAGRLSFPIGYWNGLAALIGLTIAMLAWSGANARGRLTRAASVAWIPGCALALYLTSSRGGILAAGLAIVALFGIGPQRCRLSAGVAIGVAGGAGLIAVAAGMDALLEGANTPAASRQGNVLTLLLLAAVAATGLVRYLTEGMVDRIKVGRSAAVAGSAVLAVIAVTAVVAADPVEQINQFTAGADVDPTTANFTDRHLLSATGSGRYQFWGTALDAFESAPATGIGAGGYELWWNQNGTLPRVIQNAHSLYLEMLAELGIVGFALLALLLLTALFCAWRGRLNARPEAGALLAVLVAGMTSAAIDWSWELPAVILPLIVAAGLACGPLSVGRQRDGGIRGRRLGWGALTMLAGGLALWAGGVQLLTGMKLEESRDAFSRGDLTEAAQAAQDAETVQPWAAEAYLQSALVEERAGNLAAAGQALDEAIERSPEDWQLWLVKSRIELANEDVEAARSALKRARELNPRAPVFLPDTG